MNTYPRYFKYPEHTNNGKVWGLVCPSLGSCLSHINKDGTLANKLTSLYIDYAENGVKLSGCKEVPGGPLAEKSHIKNNWVKIDDIWYFRKDRYKWEAYNKYGEPEQHYKSNVFIIDAMLENRIQEKSGKRPIFETKQVYPRVFWSGHCVYKFNDELTPYYCFSNITGTICRGLILSQSMAVKNFNNMKDEAFGEHRDKLLRLFEN